ARYRRLRCFPTRRSSDLPRGRSLLVENGYERPVAYGPEDGHHLAAGLDARLSGERLTEVEQQRDLAEQPSLRSERGHVARRHALDRKSTRLNSSHVKISY